MSELVLKGDTQISDKVYDSPIIKKNFMQSFNKKANNIVASFTEIVALTKQLKDIINPEKIYVAKFPSDFWAKNKAGIQDLRQTKSGEILASIYDKTLPGNRSTVHNLTLEKIYPSMANKVQNLSNNVMNMAVQQQLAVILEELSDVKMLVSSVRRGQILDRIALVYSGKRQLENALEAAPETRDALIQNAIQSLENGRTKLELNLREYINHINNLPTGKWRILFKNITDSKFYAMCEDTYNDFQESFRAFIEASAYLSMAYNEINSDKVINIVFEQTKSLILSTSEKMSQLSNIVVSGKTNDKNMWYKNSEAIINKIDKFTNLTQIDVAEVISIEIEGSKLLNI
jgi:hypothetical protein